MDLMISAALIELATKGNHVFCKKRLVEKLFTTLKLIVVR